MPGQTPPKHTISALTSAWLKNELALGPDLKNFCSSSRVFPGVNLHCLSKNYPGGTRVSSDK